MELFIGALNLSDAMFLFHEVNSSHGKKIELYNLDKPYEIQELVHAGAVIYFKYGRHQIIKRHDPTSYGAKSFYDSSRDALHIYF